METCLITVLPSQLQELQGWAVTPAHLAYRIGRGPCLLRSQSSISLRGGVLVVGDQGYDGFGDTRSLAQDLVRECQARNFSGAVLDFDSRLPPLRQLVCRLDPVFHQRAWRLYVPEAYGAAAPDSQVLIPSALSGGSLEQRLQEAAERFGADRITLALQKSAEDFILPAPTGCGTPLTVEELSALQQRLHPSVFFSGALCARYFTYMDPEGRAHFVLFDDGDTMQRKLETARRLGISSFICSWAEAAPYAAQLLQKAESAARPMSGTASRNSGPRGPGARR